MVDKLRLASRMGLVDVNFVAVVLNRSITKKSKIILYIYVISCLKLFSFFDVFLSDKTSISFHSAVNQSYTNCCDELQYKRFKEPR